MSQQSTAMPDPRYFLKLLPRSIRYDPISRVYFLIAKPGGGSVNPTDFIRKHITAALTAEGFTPSVVKGG